MEAKDTKNVEEWTRKIKEHFPLPAAGSFGVVTGMEKAKRMGAMWLLSQFAQSNNNAEQDSQISVEDRLPINKKSNMKTRDVIESKLCKWLDGEDLEDAITEIHNIIRREQDAMVKLLDYLK